AKCKIRDETMSIPKMMKAAVVDKFRETLSIREVSVPAPLPGEVLVEIVASGVCHTDLHAADGDWPVKPTAPFIPGHDAAGIVVVLGGRGANSLCRSYDV